MRSVDMYRRSPSVVGGTAARSTPCHRAADVVNDDARTTRGEKQCMVSAETPARAGDDSDLTVEP
jgi:hypothetical protein